MSFGENIVYYRKQLKITQEELAERLYVSRQTISRWETDSVFPDVETILKLCELFDCSMDTLVRGDAKKSVVETDNTEETPEAAESNAKTVHTARRGNNLNGTICSVIMLLAFLIFLVYGCFWNLWHPAWIAFVIGAVCCAICSVIIEGIFGSAG